MPLTADELTVLEYIYDQGEGDLDKPVDVWSRFDRHGLMPAVRRLQAAGLIKLYSLADDYTISPFGISQVSEMRIERRNGPARAAALRKSLVLWLYECYVDGETPTSTAEFHQSDRSLFVGQPFKAREIELAVSHLYSVGLLQGLQAGQINHLTNPSLTERGIECAESEKPVSEFLNPPASNGPTFNVRVDGSQNVAIGTQSDFTQNNNSGIDPAVLAQLAHFANVARQGIPSYGLEEEQQVEVARTSAELEAEAGGADPDRSRLRRLTDRLLVAIAPAAGTALGGMVTAIGEQAVQAIAG
ncbi:hypothetical protein [Streptomyces sp. ME109]|uniref:hypothetical protein n=1 Tax=Streptomyces sp. me109 TaxID=1827853 RepID=UPI0011CE15B5|nr:hypothetical protein [Streptomyces sp. me109]